MGCCGEKRKKWISENRTLRSKNSTKPKVKKQNINNHPDRIFEYTGNNSLSITGITTGNLYYFERKGETKNVNYHDSFALLAERDLKLVVPK
ncbi:MAG: hypothetical protein ABFS16_00385 [Bacteroidota bacterium]